MVSSIAIYFIGAISSFLLMRKIYINKKTFINLLICFFPLILISAFRYGVGTDYFSYVDISRDVFNRFDISLLFSHFEEPINIILYFISYKLFNTAVAVFFIYALCTHFFVALTIYELKDDINEYFFLFVYIITLYFLSFNIIRQMLAVSITMYGCVRLSKKDYKLFCLSIILSLLIHKSAIVVLLVLFISIFCEKVNTKYRDKLFFIFLCISILSIVILCPILPDILNFFGIDSKYFYTDGKLQFRFLLYIIPNLLFLIYYRNKKLISSNFDFLYYSYYLQIPFQFLGVYYSYIDRVSIPFMAMHCILYSNIFYNLNTKFRKTFIFVIAWLIIYFIVMFLIMNSNGVFPYKCILFK